MVEIFYNGKSVGRMQFDREGLYYRLSCRCNCRLEEAYRVFAVCNGEKIALGLCVPDGDLFTMHCHIPATRLPGTVERCELWPHKSENGYIRLDAQKPFPCIPLLEKARFCVRGGSPCLSIPRDLLLAVGIKDDELIP